MTTTTTLAPLISEYLQLRRARGELAAITVRDFRYRLVSLAEVHGRRPLERLGRRTIDRWLATLDGKAPATRRQYLSTVRGFTAWMVDDGRLAADPTAHVAAIRQPRRVPVTLTHDEVARLLAVATSPRARAIIWLMVGVGCRCVEVERLQTEDYDPRARTIRLVGKGGHERALPVPVTAARAIDTYLDGAGRVAGPLIRSEITPSRGIGAHHIGAIVRGLMRDAGVKVRPLDGRSAHGLRRTAASDVMDATGNIVVVQEMLGHSEVETTARHYLRRVSLEQLREAMEGRTYGAEAA